MAFLPVLIPILLIASRSFLTLETNHPSITQHIITTLGDPVIALTVGLLLALAGMNRQTRGGFSNLMNEAVEKAGSILVIIGAGGAFGAVLTATHIGETLSHTLPLTGLSLFFPFILTALLKTAQGSSTVAIITAASIIHPLQPTLGLSDQHGSLICMLSMGAGSMMISHANDAFVWVVARFGGMDLKTLLRVYSIASLLMGLTALLATYVIFLL